MGVKFRRQHVILGWIVDFWSSEARVVVEVDGGYHGSQHQRELDAVRDAAMSNLGISVLRVSNQDVLENTSAVIDRINEAVRARG